MKDVNQYVMVKRNYKTEEGMVIKNKLIHISESREGEIIYCPECDEVVKNHKKAPVPHYEHHSVGGRMCKFKIKY